MLSPNSIGVSVRTCVACQSSARLQVLSQPVIDSALEQRTQQGVLPEELEFYQSYDWCLNPYVTVNEAIAHLGEEVDKLSVVPGWLADRRDFNQHISSFLWAAELHRRASARG